MTAMSCCRKTINDGAASCRGAEQHGSKFSQNVKMYIFPHTFNTKEVPVLFALKLSTELQSADPGDSFHQCHVDICYRAAVVSTIARVYVEHLLSPSDQSELRNEQHCNGNKGNIR